jgi:hypothetical protein
MGVHDPLLAQSVVFEKGDQIVVMIVLDSLGLVGIDVLDIQEEVARKLSIANRQVIVTSSHSHHTPDTIGFWGTVIPAFSGRNEKYVAYLKAQAVKAATRAYKNRRPAKLFMGVGQESELHFNTYDLQIPNAYIDNTLTVLKAVDAKGETIATLTNWGCHATTENAENLKISSDWLHYFRDEMKKSNTGINVFVMGSIGAAIQPSVPWRDKTLGNKGQGFVWAEKMGRTLAGKANSVLAQSTPLEFEDILLVEKKIPVRMRNVAFSMAYANNQVKIGLPAMGATFETKFTAVKIGRFSMGTVPGELSPQIGMEIRKILGGDGQFIIGLGQDWLGYILDEAQYNDRMYFYEKMLCIDPKLGQNLIDSYKSVVWPTK